jgi:poly(3-hydroxybutyrate) depolymerase
MRTHFAIVWLFATIATSVGCGGDDECAGSEFSGAPVTCGTAGTFDRTVCVQGKLRKFREYVPPTLACDTPPPLVLFLHGNGGDEASGDSAQSVADEVGFVYVTLRGVEQGEYVGFGPEDIPNSRDFATRVIDQVRREFPTDPALTLITGFSGGAFFTSYCITWLNDRLRGVGIFGAGIAEDWQSQLVTARVKTPVFVRVGEGDSLRPYADSLASQLKATGWPAERINYKTFAGGHAWGPEMIRDTFDWAKSF